MRVFTYPSKTAPHKPPHKTTRHEDGSVVCSCKGFYHPGKCWHYKDVRKQFPFSDERWAEILVLVNEAKHHELLQLILSEYPNITREGMAEIIHTVVEWKCEMCGAEKQSPKGLGCTACHDE